MAAPAGGEESGFFRDFVSLLGSDVLLPLCAFVALLTILLVCIDLTSRSKSSIGACVSARSAFYLLILFVGNVLAALLLLASIADVASVREHAVGYALAGSVAGVFSFEGILSNTNITVFNRGVLTIADWIGRARDEAVTFAVEEDVRRGNRKMIEYARALAGLPEAELNTHVTNQLGNGAVAQLEQEADNARADHKLYKGLKLAATKPEYVRSVLNRR